MMMMNGRTSKYPFTPSQWQELEHQALIYNYMVSGVPVPPDLIHPMRRSFLLESTAFTSPSLAFPPQSSSWGCFQLGFGRKPEDPEPGRCRRTDGKKWRCSKEAYPDSKYCERHMHRGKNRSRKPVEMSLAGAGATPASAAYSSTSSSLPTSLYPPPSLSISTPEAYHHLMYPYSPAKRPQHAAPTYFQLDRESYSSSDKDSRYSSAVKDIDGYCFLSEAAGGERGSSLQFRPLGMNSLEQNAYSHCTTDLRKERQEEKQQQQHCFVLGADFKLEKPMKVVDAEQETRRPLRHFIDEWPQANKSPWTSMDGEHANLSFTKTQLSISTPMAHHNWFLLLISYFFSSSLATPYLLIYVFFFFFFFEQMKNCKVRSFYDQTDHCVDLPVWVAICLFFLFPT